MSSTNFSKGGTQELKQRHQEYVYFSYVYIFFHISITISHTYLAQAIARKRYYLS